MKKIHSIILIAFAGFSFTFSSCAQDSKCLVNSEDVKALNDDKIVVLDVRTPAEYEEGHLQGAKLINVNDNSFKEKIEKLDKDKAYYVYCRSGKRSSKAQNIMLQDGFKNVCNIEGGVLKMQADGVDLVKN